MKILLVLNANASSRPVAEAMSRWAATAAGEVLLLGVLDERPFTGTASERAEAVTRARLEQEGYLKQVWENHLPGVTVTTEVQATDQAARAIIECAVRSNCDVIAMGGAWPPADAGVTVEEMVRQLAPVPVVLVGPGALA